MKNTWIKPSEQLPEFDRDLEVSYDSGETSEDGVAYLKERHCMLAGTSGGNGYFGEGFGTQADNVEHGLILDTPELWRYIESN